MSTARRPLVAAAFALLVAARPMAAQTATLAPQCRAGSTQLEDACQKATDIFHFLVPQLGAAVTGGTIMPGDGVVGGRRFSATPRTNVVDGALPLVGMAMPEAGPAQRTEYAVRRMPIPSPALDVAIGLGESPRLGALHLPGVELLLNAAWIPAVGATEFTVAPSGSSLRVGYGARVGLLREGPSTPSVTLAWVERGLPGIDVSAHALGSDDTLAVRRFSLRSRAWRVTMQRSGARGALWMSAGGDEYSASGRLAPVMREDGERYAPGDGDAGYLLLLASRAHRATIAAGAARRVGRLQFVGETGFVSGGHVSTYNGFGGARPDEARMFASLGFRID